MIELKSRGMHTFEEFESNYDTLVRRYFDGEWEELYGESWEPITSDEEYEEAYNKLILEKKKEIAKLYE